MDTEVVDTVCVGSTRRAWSSVVVDVRCGSTLCFELADDECAMGVADARCDWGTLLDATAHVHVDVLHRLAVVPTGTAAATERLVRIKFLLVHPGVDGFDGVVLERVRLGGADVNDLTYPGCVRVLELAVVHPLLRLSFQRRVPGHFPHVAGVLRDSFRTPDVVEMLDESVSD